MPASAMEQLIPPYLAADRVLPQAMIDHVEIVFGDWSINGAGHNVLRFEDALPEILAVTNAGVEVQVFTNANRSPDGRWVAVDVSKGRRGNISYQTRPIFGGTLTHAFGAGRVPRHSREYVRLGLEAHVNVNNFLMAQTVRRRSRIDRPALESPLATAMQEEFAGFRDEYCLTDDTNVLMGPPLLFHYVLSKPAEDHFMDCLHLIETFVTTELRETADAYQVSVDHDLYCSLRKMEFVWEFAHPNPVRFVESLDVPMRALGSASRRHRALVRGESLRVRQDSISVSAELSAGCDLIVYAKTNERIRFEVRLDRDAIASMLRRSLGDHSRTARDYDDLRQMVATLRVQATERMEAALNILDRQRIPPASDVTPMQLCAKVGRILQDDKLSHDVLETLRMRGSLASALRSPLRDAAERLKDEGILIRAVSRKGVFVPTDAYVQAVGGLQNQGSPQPNPGTPVHEVDQVHLQRPRGIVKRIHLPKSAGIEHTTATL